ncbi:MAG: hypothetical protein QOH91_4600 [Mycobacterium sp.]|nr:hypothetical protein [Mycobacterium sp.]
MALRAHAAGLLCAVAAVELVVGHAVWLRRNDFVDGFVRIADELAGESSPAWVDWHAAVTALDAGRLPCSNAEAGVLRVAASVAEGIPVDLGEVLTGLDERNLVLVAGAVLRAGGSTAPVGAGVGGGDRR